MFERKKHKIESLSEYLRTDVFLFELNAIEYDGLPKYDNEKADKVSTYDLIYWLTLVEFSLSYNYKNLPLYRFAKKLKLKRCLSVKSLLALPLSLAQAIVADYVKFEELDKKKVVETQSEKM